MIEHVPEDDKAIAEVARILKKQGLAIFTIPGNWRRNKTITFKDLSFNPLGCYTRGFGFGFRILAGLFGPKEKFGNLCQYHIET